MPLQSVVSLSDACLKGDYASVAKYACSVDLNRANKQGWIPLHAAISSGFPQIVALLIEKFV